MCQDLCIKSFHPYTTPGCAMLCLVMSNSLRCDPWSVAYQAPLSLGILQSGLPCPPPGGRPNPGIKHRSPSRIAGKFFTV